METISQFNPDLGNLAWSATLIDKVHNCADCPIRREAMKQPRSVFARIHAWHTTWWPGWKAHQARQCAYRAAAGTRA